MTAGRFHHDHVGAEVAEQLAGERGVLAGQLHDPQADQGPRRLGGVAHVTPSFASCSISASSSPRISDSTWSIVLTQTRTAPLDHPVGLRQVHGQAVDAHVAHLAVVRRRPEPPLGGAGIVVDPILRAGHRRRRHAGGAQRLGHREPVARDRPRRHPLVERILHRQALGHRVVARVERPRLADHRGEVLPVGVVATGDGHPVVLTLGGVDAVGRHRRRVTPVRVGLPGPAQRAPVDRVVEQVGPDQRGAGLGARHVDPLALAGAVAMDQPGEDGDGHDVGAHVVHVRVAPTGGRLVGQARAEGEPGDGLHDRAPGLERRVRAGGAEAGVRHVDDVGLDRPQLLVGEAHAREHAGGEVLGDHVGDGDELAQQLACRARCAG